MTTNFYSVTLVANDTTMYSMYGFNASMVRVLFMFRCHSAVCPLYKCLRDSLHQCNVSWETFCTSVDSPLGTIALVQSVPL